MNVMVVALKAALLNEKCSPELLPFQDEVVTDLSQALKEQQEILDSATFAVSDLGFAALYQMEVDRVRYLLASYHRVRLAKLKKFVMYILSSRDVFEGRLSAQEKTFVTRYADLKEAHFRASALDQLDDRLRSLDEPEMISEPNMGEWVFCRVLKDQEDFIPADAPTSEPITMNRGDSLVIKYSAIRSLLADGAVELA